MKNEIGQPLKSAQFGHSKRRQDREQTEIN